MKKYLAEKHQISYPYTPEQNGLAERKHKHYVELGLSMMFQSHLPLHLWVEALSAANYIINLLPSEVLDNKSPFEKLYVRKPAYEDFRVLGSAYYPCLQSLQAHKLEPKIHAMCFCWVQQPIQGISLYVFPNRKILYFKACDLQ